MALTLFTVGAALLVIGLSVREIAAFVRARGAFRLRRLTLRMTTAIMLLFLLASIYLGVQVFDLGTPRGLPRHWLAFWGSVLLLAWGILCLTVADFRMLREETRRDVNTLWRDTLVQQAPATGDDDEHRNDDHA